MHQIFATLLALSLPAPASQYPADYCHQTVRLRHDGPAVFASVGSGCLSDFVIGYRNSGVLAQSNPDSIDAIVIGQCRLRDHSDVTRTSVVKLGREWHGHGYLSTAMSSYSLLPDTCYNIGDTNAPPYNYQFAFSDGRGGWDSRYGANYQLQSVRSPEGATVFQTNADGMTINAVAWDFIVEQMK